MTIIEPTSADTNERRALETLGRLTGGALHEIANPLVGMTGAAELALAEAEPETRLHQRIQVIQQTAGEISTIVRALQAFLREQGEPPRRVSLGSSAQAAVALVTLVAPKHDVMVTAVGEAEVVAEPGVVARELVELLHTALKGAEPGSSVELSVTVAGQEAVAAVPGGGELRLRLA
jgi:two-component system, NtrC family, C4-dicarboxylate transport sensor histidine kinase DctB